MLWPTKTCQTIRETLRNSQGGCITPCHRCLQWRGLLWSSLSIDEKKMHHYGKMRTQSKVD